MPISSAPSAMPRGPKPRPYSGKRADVTSLLHRRTDVSPATTGAASGAARTPDPTTLRRWQHRYSHYLRISDSVIVVAAVMLAQYVRFGDSPNKSGYPGPVMTLFSVLFAALWLTSLAIFNTRSPHVIGVGIDEYRRISSASFWTFGIIAMVTLLAKIELARGYLAVALPVGTLGLLTSRNSWRRYICRKRAHGEYQTASLAIGDRQGLSRLVQELDRNPRDGYVVVGVCIPGYGPPRAETLMVEGRNVPILGDESYAVTAVDECGAGTVVVTQTEHFGMHAIRDLIWQLETKDVDLVVSPGMMDIAEARLTVRPVAGFPLLHVEKPLYTGAQRFQKRTFDFCFALAALLVTSPILIAAAIAIRLTSKGPVFYRSERIGINGEPFMMLKLRTMEVDADRHLDLLLSMNQGAGGILFKMRQDPRVTPVGRILRRYSIDELPQFINVIKQDMSVVGPRPPLSREVDNYNVDVKRRLLVKPGVTGIWQVSGRSELSWEESVRLDLSYVDNWSMAGDLMIIAKTGKAVLTGHGAY
ncbi:putative sugar transferase EpsL [Mycobacterium attenuatum]|uniref:Putative sugar transferase EpsL n=2 Tax=Mycobacterium attenuatum TaxID=2341086 RepID=A0A498QB50_9MYCO|nr:putative sugar transferase EpsL [Mycobacterium attenuatum]VBA58112.1 putative sugar transferase EpsL [Mycobacterium attenuatum]VBA61108.1 putative sugar transferase EpsL [Mycobacterium attenuatum]